jgi:hypothetical protein
MKSMSAAGIPGLMTAAEARDRLTALLLQKAGGGKPNGGATNGGATSFAAKLWLEKWASWVNLHELSN